MKPTRDKRRPVEIEVTSEQIAFWKCAAALDPVPPTWAGPTWAELLSAPVGSDTSSMTVLFPISFLSEFRSGDDKATMHFVVPSIITDHALHILERHGLQRIPVNHMRLRTPDTDEDIPF
jgi:hypothetical protein